MCHSISRSRVTLRGTASRPLAGRVTACGAPRGRLIDSYPWGAEATSSSATPLPPREKAKAQHELHKVTSSRHRVDPMWPVTQPQAQRLGHGAAGNRGKGAVPIPPYAGEAAEGTYVRVHQDFI